MRDNAVTITRSPARCVLAFEAKPAEMRVLRRSVREHLRQWSAFDLADEVELAVTELATNVIKHVGERSAATLVMEASAATLRVEVHDTSHQPPIFGEPECGAECGRGLHLLVGMALDWGTVQTATGKAVWCEFSMAACGQRWKVERALAALVAYRGDEGVVDLSLTRVPVLEDSATSLIADLLYCLMVQGSDPVAVLEHAQDHYVAECRRAG
ncbi:ATP-binding protein [Streptomyces sp. NBC_00237]|uniref:ATP-binding protein n=1 Tax=Streptomyces sp. NBC_00237 TaxID=2975687 RepID=UPI00224EE783|nr:ATP-binding protein [Streptomyces sp. NBC_00237]MCX5200959.1 ATP-binding protein [Streptomyces sp. NBC_00237]